MVRTVLFVVSIFLMSHLSVAQIFIPHSFYAAQSNSITPYTPTPTAGACTLAGSAGMTQIVNNTFTDDNNIGVILPFYFYLAGSAYANWFVGSNFYITAGTGSSLYSALNAGTPALPKFHLGAADACYYNVYKKSGTNYTRIRVEGCLPYNAGSINSTFEFTFFRPTGGVQYAQVAFAAMASTAGQFGVASSTAYYASSTFTQNTCYLFTSNTTGTTWTITPNQYISGAATNL